MWLTEMRVKLPSLKLEYEVGQIPQDDHTVIAPYDELVQIRGSDEGVVVVDLDTQP